MVQMLALATIVAVAALGAASLVIDPTGSELNSSAQDTFVVPAPTPPAVPSKHAAAAGTDDNSTDDNSTIADLAAAAAATTVISIIAAVAAALIGSKARRAAAWTVASTTVRFWRCLVYFWRGGSYAQCPHFADNVETRVHLRSLALINELWAQPHYRNGNFGEDMRKNLRNVAVPGTGLPLSALCFSQTLFKLVLLAVYPVVCFAAAVTRRKPEADAPDVAAQYAKHLLNPTDWFSLWRLNCRVASYHALKTADAGYNSEDKWTFITDALAKNIPVSPIMELPSIVCKDRNEEGGMGIHFFKNALAGGDWIIQKALHNSEFLSSMLPAGAPLSTIRIVTASRNSFAADHPEPITPLSGVFRAGRAGALTDHDAILFDLDLDTGVIGEGSINKEWYQLGLGAATGSAAEDTKPQSFSSHPDCGATVTGRTIPGIEQIKQIVVDAHAKSCPNVPLCGWDVALTTEGVCLLEVNLSCNFFQATVDYPNYFEFVDAQFKHLEAL